MMNPTMGVGPLERLLAGLEWHKKYEPDANISINPIERDELLALLAEAAGGAFDSANYPADLHLHPARNCRACGKPLSGECVMVDGVPALHEACAANPAAVVGPAISPQPGGDAP